MHRVAFNCKVKKQFCADVPEKEKEIRVKVFPLVAFFAFTVSFKAERE